MPLLARMLFHTCFSISSSRESPAMTQMMPSAANDTTRVRFGAVRVRVCDFVVEGFKCARTFHDIGEFVGKHILGGVLTARGRVENDRNAALVRFQRSIHYQPLHERQLHVALLVSLVHAHARVHRRGCVTRQVM